MVINSVCAVHQLRSLTLTLLLLALINSFALLRLDEYISNKSMVQNTKHRHGRPKFKSSKKDGRGRAGSKGYCYLVDS